jgi:hypothetical protein
MTMQNHDHPSEERLAALAGGDAEATEDRALRVHVEGCAPCTSLLRQLSGLRAAMAELPDVVPTRRLQLVPPVHAPAAPAGWRAALRRLAAPAMTLGAGLAILGAVGLGGMAVSTGTGGAAAPALSEDGNDDRGVTEGASMQPNGYGDQSAAPGDASVPPADESSQPPFGALTDTSTPLPWLVLVLGGAVLLVTGLVLRFSISPRAG